MTKLFSFIELDDGLLHMDEMRTALPGATRLLFMAFSSCEQAEQTLAAPGSSIRWTPNDTPSYEVDETTIERVAPLGWLRASLMADTLEHATAQPATRPARPRTL